MRTAVGWLLLVLCLALAGCSRAVDAAPAPTVRDAGAGELIQPAQLADLLTPSASLAVVPGRPLFEEDLQTDLFIGADPATCHGTVGFGHYPLFPSNYTGREARTQVDNGSNQHELLEAAATYPHDFDAARFVDSVRKTVSSCRHTVTAWADDEHRMTVTPGPLNASAPDVAPWTTTLSGQQWICDFAMIAKANVVSQIERPARRTDPWTSGRWSPSG